MFLKIIYSVALAIVLHRVATSHTESSPKISINFHKIL
jgi:hypothetical protein